MPQRTLIILSVALLVLVYVSGCANVETIKRDAEIQTHEVNRLWGSRGVAGLRDADWRAEIAPEMKPALRELCETLERLEGAQRGAEKATTQHQRLQYLATLVVLDDRQAHDQLQHLAGAKPRPHESGNVIPFAKLAKLRARWILTGWDEAEQLRVLEEAEVLAKAHPTDTFLPFELNSFDGPDLGPSAPQAHRRIKEIFAQHLRGPVADRYAAMITQRGLLGNVSPLQPGQSFVLEGKTLDGAEFSTTQWRGKVVVIDFWATWCGPCIATMPYLEKAYGKYHEQGLEVIGVSWDTSPEPIKQFIAKREAMVWPHLFDPYHTLSQQLGIDNIPRVLVIDRKGVLRLTEMPTDQVLQKLLAAQP